MAVTDSTLLIYLLDGTKEYATDHVGGRVDGVQERITHLISTLEARRERLIIPTPVLAEALVKAGEAGPEYLRQFQSRSVFEIASFDTKAAIELAQMTARVDVGTPKADPIATKAKVKFDRQIVAIAKAKNESVIYSNDTGVRKFAKGDGLTVLSISELPLPPTSPQLAIDLEVAERAQEVEVEDVLIPEDQENQCPSLAGEASEEENLAPVEENEDSEPVEENEHPGSVEEPPLENAPPASR